MFDVLRSASLKETPSEALLSTLYPLSTSIFVLIQDVRWAKVALG